MHVHGLLVSYHKLVGHRRGAIVGPACDEREGNSRGYLLFLSIMTVKIYPAVSSLSSSRGYEICIVVSAP
jgi:hypothetical protein